MLFPLFAKDQRLKPRALSLMSCVLSLMSKPLWFRLVRVRVLLLGNKPGGGGNWKSRQISARPDSARSQYAWNWRLYFVQEIKEGSCYQEYSRCYAYRRLQSWRCHWCNRSRRCWVYSQILRSGYELFGRQDHGVSWLIVSMMVSCAIVSLQNISGI